MTSSNCGTHVTVRGNAHTAARRALSQVPGKGGGEGRGQNSTRGCEAINRSDWGLNQRGQNTFPFLDARDEEGSG